MKSNPRWYSRSNWPYLRDRSMIKEYANWLGAITWDLFGTFTFAWPVSDPQANKIWEQFVETLERHQRAPVFYVRGDEKRYSGCGKPGAPRHFHAVLGCISPLKAHYLSRQWTKFAGSGLNGAGAKVSEYDTKRGGLAYCLKLLHHSEGDWKFAHLDLAMGDCEANQTARRRRRTRRHKNRLNLLQTRGLGLTKEEGEFENVQPSSRLELPGAKFQKGKSNTIGARSQVQTTKPAAKINLLSCPSQKKSEEKK